MKPTIKPEMKTTVHRDGSVSYWSVNNQVWQRVGAGDLIQSKDFPTLNEQERARISKMVSPAE